VHALLFCLLAQECLDELELADACERAAFSEAQASVDALRQSATNAAAQMDVEKSCVSTMEAMETAGMGEALRAKLKRPNMGKHDACHRVLPGMWLGGVAGLAKDGEELRRRKVTHLVSVISTQSCEIPSFIRGHLHILSNDTEEAAEGLSAHFAEVCRFVDAARSEPRGCVYIHCGAGISRSPTVAASYVMWKLGVSAAAALQLIKRARPNIRPNVGFVKQLRQWEVDMLALPGGGKEATDKSETTLSMTGSGSLEAGVIDSIIYDSADAGE